MEEPYVPIVTEKQTILLIKQEGRMGGTEMSFNLRKAKRLTKRITKYEHYISKVSEWLKKDKKELNKLLKTITNEENMQYGLQEGFISEEDYKEMKPVKPNQ